MKNKIIAIISALVITTVCSAALVSCSEGATDGKIKIVATVFPEYDWIMNVLGEKKDDYSVTLLADSKADLHNYQPTVADIATVSSCDLFIYVGGESDDWAEDALKNAINKNMKTINLLETLGEMAKEEKLVEGMQGEEEADEDEEEGIEYDEHVWLSLKNAAIFVKEIKNVLSGLDAANAGVFESNANEYISKLAALDTRYEQAVAEAKVKTLLFGNRFPFRYLVDDYGLDYYAAFVGCSAETEASFETVIFLANKVDELGLKNIMIIESSDGKIARTVRDNTRSHDQNILTMDSLQSSTIKEYLSGRTYLGVMEQNLSVLIEALG